MPTRAARVRSLTSPLEVSRERIERAWVTSCPRRLRGSGQERRTIGSDGHGASRNRGPWRASAAATARRPAGSACARRWPARAFGQATVFRAISRERRPRAARRLHGAHATDAGWIFAIGELGAAFFMKADIAGSTAILVAVDVVNPIAVRSAAGPTRAAARRRSAWILARCTGSRLAARRYIANIGDCPRHRRKKCAVR